MTNAELEKWVDEAYDSIETIYGAHPGTWWPQNNLSGQGDATNWSWAILFQALLARYHDVQHDAWFCAPFHGHRHRERRGRLLEQFWSDRSPRWRHEEKGVVVDYLVHDCVRENPIVLTAESEVYSYHGVGDSLARPDDYSWDFYKLLLTPSPLRLFIARVGSRNSQSGQVRRDELIQSLSVITSRFARTFLKENDELGVVLIPEAFSTDDWKDLRILVWNGTVFTATTPWKP